MPAHPDQSGLIDAQLHCDGIGGLEPDAADVACQAIGVLRHNLHGIGAVGLVDAYRPCRAHIVAMQKNHDLADHLLLGPGGDDATGPFWPDAVHFPKAVRLCLDDVEYLVAEGVQQLLGIDRANAANHSRGEVLLDAVDRGGHGGLEEPGFELLAVGTVVDPAAGRRNPLAGRDRGGMTNQSDELAMASDLNPNDAKAILGALVSDALDQSRQHLAVGRLGLDLHEPRHSVR
jgi:hypothetical protein